jgi:bacterioferritin
MKGDSKVIDALNEVLTAELTAINQYFLHAEMCENWGYHRLEQRMRREAIEEMKHAERIIQRVLFLEGLPNVQRLGKISIGQTVPEILRADLALEVDAVKRLNAAIALARETGDNGTRELLDGILGEEEDHVDWAEAQLTLLAQAGEANYLAQQFHAES